MTSILSRGRNVALALAAAATIGVVAAPSDASAKNWHRHGGYGAAAIGGGLLLGALIATQPRQVYVRDCWIEKRKRYAAYGDRYVVNVKVCD